MNTRAAVRTSPARSGRRLLLGFTLIELVVVLAVILILAALILHVAGSVNQKSSAARAQSEIQAFTTALEGYKSDYAIYPRSATATDVLNAAGTNQAAIDPATSPSGSPPLNPYQATSVVMYQALAGISFASASATPVFGKQYMTFQPSQLSTGSGTPSSGTYIIDPFGYSYGYSTCNVANSGGAGYGFNPTYDLWSTAGYSPTGGKPYPSASPTVSPSSFWIKNW